jgi:hypothetical protein
MQARSTTTMTDEERIAVRHMINQSIDRLQKASVGANQMGNRYARLVQLLWRKPPKRDNTRHQSIDARLTSGPIDPALNPALSNSQYVPNTDYGSGFGGQGMGVNNGGAPGFSWLDLSATWNFATQNGNANSSSGSASDLQDEIGIGGAGDNISPFDMALLTDYNLLDGDGSSFVF